MISRFLGLIGFVGCLVTVFYFEGHSASEGILRIFHWPAMVLTGLGPLSMVFISYDLSVIKRTIQKIGLSPEERINFHEREARMLHRLGAQFYEQGPEVFETVKLNGVSERMHKMVERLAVRLPTADIIDMLAQERDRNLIHLVQTLNVVGLGVKLSPSIGMLGTILGMVNLLSTLQDPSGIGSAMSLALLTTFYGLFFSIAVWTPLQQRIERVLDAELEGFDQCIRWLELLDKRKPTEYFADSVGLQPQKKAA